MTKDKIKEYFSNIEMQRKVKKLTIVMFIALIIEKICSGAVAVYNNGVINFEFTLTSIDILCVLIYVATTLLVAAEVRYQYIVIPDMILLGVKIFNIIYGIVYILYNDVSIVKKCALIEKIIESIIFTLFLIILFIGKLSKGKYLSDFSVLCLRILMVCFASTVVFEVIEIGLAVESHKYPFLIFFDFVKGILNEAFLDMPYFLLVLTLCFTDENVLFHSKLEKYISHKKIMLVDKK